MPSKWAKDVSNREYFGQNCDHILFVPTSKRVIQNLFRERTHKFSWSNFIHEKLPKREQGESG